jgi:hypothetical protein
MPIPFPYPKIRSKLNRAIAQYLIINGVGTSADVFPAHNIIAKLFPYTVVKSTVGKPEVPMSGIYRVQVAIQIYGSAVVPKDSNLTRQDMLDAFEYRVGQTHAALMQTDTYGQSLFATAVAITQAGNAMAVAVDQTPAAIAFAKQNIDMAAFTCGAWYDAGFGDTEPDDVDCDFRETLLFEAQVAGNGGLN